MSTVTVYTHVNVDVDDIISDIGDDEIEREYRRRSGNTGIFVNYESLERCKEDLFLAATALRGIGQLGLASRLEAIWRALEGKK